MCFTKSYKIAIIETSRTYYILSERVKTLRIALFTDTYLPQINGVSETIVKFIDYMERHNIEYRIFCPKYDRKTVSDKHIIRLRSVKFVFYKQCRLSIPRYSIISKELHKFKPDIIHSMTSFGIGITGFRYARRNDIPLAASYETNIPQYLDYYHLTFLKNFSWDFYNWFHKHCDINYVPSKATYELLEEKTFENLELWDRGVEIERFTPEHRDENFRELRGLQDKVVFLYVGRVSPEKDLDVFMKVAENINISHPGKAHFIVVGDGPSLKDLKKNAPENITFTGFLRGQELLMTYASSDVFLFPSPTETLGFVLLEAFASGLPAVACYEGGIRDNLVDGHNGIACKEKDADAFYLGCAKLINDCALREKMAENARNYVLEKSWEKAFDRLVASYNDVIEKKNEQLDYEI